MPKVVGVLKGVVINYGSSRRTHKPTKQKTTANKSLKQIEKEKQAHAYKISVLSFTQREHILYSDLLQNQNDQGSDVMHQENGNLLLKNLKQLFLLSQSFTYFFFSSVLSKISESHLK